MKIGYVCIAFCLVSSLACGDDSNGSDDDDGKSKAGRGGSTARAGANAGATAGTGGGIAGLPDLTGLLTPMCNPDAESVTSCGGTDCPELPEGSDMTCTVTCCSNDDRCGTRSADTRIESVLGVACNAPALPDTRCPDLTLAGFSAPGCCTENNTCGQIVANLCIAALTPRACDAPPVAADDAGI